MPVESVYVLLAIILAIMGDLWLMRRWRQSRIKDDASSGQQVRLLGSDSPVLTWLKYRTWRPIQIRFDRKAWRPSSAALELAVIVMVAVAYAYPLLDLDPNLTLPGGEYQAHVGVVVPFIQWLQGGEFPLWNPVVGNGRSWIADPFLFVFNPFLSLPIAIMGVVNGSKVAAVLNYLVAGVGVWVLCRLIGLGWLSRLHYVRSGRGFELATCSGFGRVFCAHNARSNQPARADGLRTALALFGYRGWVEAGRRWHRDRAIGCGEA